MAKRKVRVLFLYESHHRMIPKDGMRAALDLLEKEYEITRINLLEEEPILDEYDFIIAWTNWGGRIDALMDYPTKAKKGIAICGAFPPRDADRYDVIWYENEWYKDMYGLSDGAIHAFGVNTDIYKPMRRRKTWDILGVGSYSSWKRWEKLAVRPGHRIVIGEYQRDNENESLSIVRELIRSGVVVSDMVNPDRLAEFYNLAKEVYIPAELFGGGERAVLEARACGTPVSIERDNEKLAEYLNCPIWDHHYYAAQLKKGIERAL